jgi:hypothetical protein
MLASYPASMVNQNSSPEGIPLRFKSARKCSSGVDLTFATPPGREFGKWALGTADGGLGRQAKSSRGLMGFTARRTGLVVPASVNGLFNGW